MKPDWSTAPKWAQWWARDKCGASWWFSQAPFTHSRRPEWVGVWEMQCDKVDLEDVPDWKSTLTKRPQEESK